MENYGKAAHYDCETDTLTTRDLTAEELAELQKFANEQAQKDAEIAAAKANRDTVLAALAAAAGLELDEVKAALGA